FNQIRPFEIDGTIQELAGVSFTATRLFQNKRTWMSWSGDAFYDWHTNSFTVPANGTITSGYIDTKLVTWDDFDEEIPDTVRFRRIEGRGEQVWNYSVAVPALLSL